LRLVALNRFFWPDHSATSQLLTDLARHLAAQGHRVTVIASRQRYDDPKAALPARETVDGVRVVRVWTTRLGRHWLPGRALDYATFYLAAFVTLCTLVLAFVRVSRGPTAEDRLLGIQSFGTVGTTVVVLLSLTTEQAGYLDVALVMALLAAVTIITFTRVLPLAGENDPHGDADTRAAGDESP
jgi:multisubunit Na+/H+ antiporter MnhF subunit